MLVGNKSDLENQRKIPKEMGELFAEEEGLLFGEASAKSGEGVEGLFMEIGTSSLPSFSFPSSSSHRPLGLNPCNLLGHEIWSGRGLRDKGGINARDDIDDSSEITTCTT
jgi:hypothetical protein